MPIYPIRPIRIEGQVAYVPLTQGYVAIIDTTDVHLVDQFNWYAKVTPRTVYAYRNILMDKGTRMPMSIHRILLDASGDMQVDHINGYGLDNRRENLRPATNAQNARNRGAQSNNMSGFKGVSWSKSNQKWQAQIGLNGHRKHLGFFTTPEEAYEIYIESAVRLHGEFACAARDDNHSSRNSPSMTPSRPLPYASRLTPSTFAPAFSKTVTT